MKAGVKRFETLAGTLNGGRMKIIRSHNVRLELKNLPGTAPPQ